MIVTAERINQLKAEVKAECLRRSNVSTTSGSTSVASYGGASYDFTNTPAAGIIIDTEHREKNLTPLKAINPSTLPITSGEVIIDDEDIVAMESFITLCKAQGKEDKTASRNTCSGGCTGLCYTTCTGGCTGSCTSACAQACSNNCTTGCYTSCRGCDGTCSGTCDGDCDGSCTGTCDGSCTGAACGAACESYCASNGCFGQTCKVSCITGNGCRGTCQGISYS